MYLITGTKVLKRSFYVDAIRDFRRLLFNCNKDITSLVIESFVTAVIPDLLNSVADNLLIIKSRFSSDFAKHHNHSGFGGGLTGNFGKRIFGKTCIKL